jgi:hypothetical protein
MVHLAILVSTDAGWAVMNISIMVRGLHLIMMSTSDC